MQAEGWDFEDDVANNDIEGNVNREEAVDAQEEEEAELEREHEELEKILKKEGRVDKEEKEEDEGYKVDLDEDERGESMPAVAASRLMEQEAEKEGRKHMDKLRKRVKVPASPQPQYTVICTVLHVSVCSCTRDLSSAVGGIQRGVFCIDCCGVWAADSNLASKHVCYTMLCSVLRAGKD